LSNKGHILMNKEALSISRYEDDCVYTFGSGSGRIIKIVAGFPAETRTQLQNLKSSGEGNARAAVMC